jgi:chemotaxis protein CheX
MLTEVSAEMLAQTVESVFMNMMGLEVDRCAIPWVADANRLTASVHMEGQWNGALFFECDRWQACQFAGRFLGNEAPGAVDDDVRDVLGELANMIGGNIKFAMGKGLSLSLPSVTDAGDDSPRVSAFATQDRLSFQCADGAFWVTLLTTGPEGS